MCQCNPSIRTQSAKGIIAIGKFENALDFAEFIDMFSQSELSKPQHHVKLSTLQVVEADHLELEYKMFIKEHAGFLISDSLKDGMLRFWSSNFTLKEGE